MTNTPDWLIEELHTLAGRYYAAKRQGDTGQARAELLNAAATIQARFEAAVGEKENFESEADRNIHLPDLVIRNSHRDQIRRAWSGEGEQK